MVGIFTVFIVIVAFFDHSICGPIDSDPCSTINCGKGAICRLVSSLVVCICPQNYEGDPFDECTQTNSSRENTESTPKMSIGTTTAASSQIVLDDNTNEPSSDNQPSDFHLALPTLSHYAHSMHSKMDTMQQQHFPTHQVDFNSNRKDTTNTVSYPGTMHSQAVYPKPPEISQIGYGDELNPVEHKETDPISSFTPPNYTNDNSYRILPIHRLAITSLETFPSKMQSSHNFHPISHNQDSAAHEHGTRVKDPLGLYSLCKNMNNRIVCADLTQNEDKIIPQRVIPVNTNYPLTSNNYGFEHRIIAVNDNPNSHNPSNSPFEPIRNKDTLINERTRTSTGRPYPLNDHHSGSFGVINFNHERLKVKDEHSSGPLIHPNPSLPQMGIHESNQGFIPPIDGENGGMLCQKMCGEGALCRVIQNHAVCGCPEGTTGDPSKKCFAQPNTKYDPNSCLRHENCPSTMICADTECRDPCTMKDDTHINISSHHEALDSSAHKKVNLCGANTKCTVIEHTPICSCNPNFFGNPYIGCVP